MTNPLLESFPAFSVPRRNRAGKSGGHDGRRSAFRDRFRDDDFRGDDGARTRTGFDAVEVQDRGDREILRHAKQSTQT
ncbi:MAG: hypothetical protein V4801_40810 [Burkholderia gladioli]